MNARRGRNTSPAKDGLPHSVEAEISVLGAALQDRLSAEAAAQTLRVPDFFLSAHQHIFSATLSLLARNVAPDLITIGNELLRRKQLDAVGGGNYLAGLVDQVPTAANVAYHAAIVKHEAGLRRIVESCMRASERAKSNGMDPGAVVADLWEELRPLESPDESLGPVLVRLEDVASKPVTWLWPGRIPQGKLTLIVGDPGLGKSFLTIDLSARSTRGAPWPDGEPGRTSDVVILTAEDGLADTVRPRLDALGGDPARIHVLTGIGDPEKPATFNLARDIPHLEDAVLRTRASLVVIDPLSAYLAGIDSHKDADVRSILAPLAAMAERNGVAVVSVVHMNKGQQRQALYRAQGSLAFVAAARAVFGVAEDLDNPGRRLFVPLKMNVAPKPPGLAFRLDGGRLTWEAGTVDVDADAALGGREASAERSEREEAAEFLREILADGSMSADEVKRQARGAGISEMTLRRARADLRVEIRKAGFRQGWIWTLPSKVLMGDHVTEPDHLRHLRGEVNTFEDDQHAEGVHEDAHPSPQVSTFDTPPQQQQLTHTLSTKNTKVLSESKERPW
ncbi:MAG: AAA family ATPase [Candidatus Rokubacteria bacterium]|nr:AAA family ATPase [Candidatus Rokubacteria bacterium]